MTSPVPKASGGVIPYLLGKYYRNGETSDTSLAMSSHWQHYSKFFRVSTDETGELTSLSGVGFGDITWHRTQRVLDPLCIWTHLFLLPARTEILRYWSRAVRLCRKLGTNPTFDVFRQACALEFIAARLPETLKRRPIRLLAIGDGFGFFSMLFKEHFPNSSIVFVDLGQTLLFQAYYCQQAYPDYPHRLAEALPEGDLDATFLYCPADELARIEGLQIDLAVNINSMQEMNPHMVEVYFSFIRRHCHPDNLFYCCNRESKAMPCGKVSEIRNYPWIEADQVLVDDYCPWHRFFLSYRKAHDYPTLLGVKVPFVNFYDGRTLHRLVKMATVSAL